MSGRYAEGTAVTVESSRGEISGILVKHGCQRMGWDSGPEGDSLRFVLNDHPYRFDIRHPMQDSPDARKVWHNRNARRDVVDQAAAEWRRRWRATVLLLKAKLEFVASGDTTMEREFLPYLLTAGGQTFAEWMETTAGQKLIGAGA